MNFLASSLMSVARTCLRSVTESNKLGVTKYDSVGFGVGSILNMTRTCLGNTLQGLQQARSKTTLLQMLKRNRPYIKQKAKKKCLDGKPFAKGVVLRTVVRKPKKPNSANRKCVIVRLSTGREMHAYVPGEGHNLQEHNIVLVKVAKLQDVPGVNLCCVRGKYDLPHVVPKK